MPILISVLIEQYCNIFLFFFDEFLQSSSTYRTYIIIQMSFHFIRTINSKKILSIQK